MTLQTPSDPEHLVECLALDGRTVLVPAEQLIIRPAAYALLIDSGRLLLLRSRATGKYHLRRRRWAWRADRTGLAARVREEPAWSSGDSPGALQELFSLRLLDGHTGLHFYYRCCPPRWSCCQTTG